VVTEIHRATRTPNAENGFMLFLPDADRLLMLEDCGLYALVTDEPRKNYVDRHEARVADVREGIGAK
jgi:hypothetical protein